VKKLKQAGGNWVSGDRFWNRENDVELFMKQIEEGAHLLLVAQRRMGKTSLMQEAARRLGGRFTCLFVDVQKAASPSDAIVELSKAIYPHKKVWKKAVSVFGNVAQELADRIEKVNIGQIGVKLRAGLTEGNWVAKGDELLAILADVTPAVVLLLDEVPVLVNRMLKNDEFTITAERRRAVDRFMSWVRDNTIRHRGKLRIVVSGSIGFEPVLRQAGLSATLNTFQPFELKPWDDATAVGCIEALAAEYGVIFDEGIPAEMVRRLGCNVPHHVQMFFTHVWDACKRANRMTVTSEDAAKVYGNEMLGVRGHAELTHYEERLKMVLGSETLPLALDMVTEAAVTGCLGRAAIADLRNEYAFEGRKTAEVQEEILRVLEHDGYLEGADDGYVFVSRLLRDWWRKRYGNLFIPVAQRKA